MAKKTETKTEKLEREYTIPDVQTSQEVISYYAKRIAADVKLPSQFAALVPKIREFLQTKAFMFYPKMLHHAIF